MHHPQQRTPHRRSLGLIVLLAIACLWLAAPSEVWAQAPGTAPVTVSHKTQMLHGRKYYVHIVEKGQTVYSISKAYKVESYDAVTHVDIHFLHPGDTVWLPCRGQFTNAAEEIDAQPTAPVSPAKEAPTEAPDPDRRPTPAPVRKEAQTQATPPARKPGSPLKVALMMPLHLDQIDEISTSKFDIEQRGKKSYRQFEFIEFYEGVSLALDRLSAEGVSIELNVVDVSDNAPSTVERAFGSHHVAQSDLIIALLLRDAFDRASELARDAGVYIVNPMATRSEICTDNPYVVKIQASLESQAAIMLDNIQAERPEAHLYIVYSNSKSEKPMLEALKHQLASRPEIKYTLFNWSQSARLASTLKATPGSSIISLYDQGKDNNRVYAGNLLNRLSAFKAHTPTLYSVADWTHEYNDIDYAQLQQVNYHTFSSAWDMTNQVHIDFLQAFRDRFSTEPTTPLAATGYDLMLYLGEGIGQHGGSFWQSPADPQAALTHPIRLVRSGSGLENDKAALYRMEDYRFVPAATR